MSLGWTTPERSAVSLTALSRVSQHGQTARVTLRVFAFLCVFGTAAFAADDSTVFVPKASRTDVPAAVAAGPTLNSVSLILGVALAGVGGWLVWRNRRGTPIGRDQRLLAVDETRSLGNRQFLVVASYEGRKFLIGVCPGRIDMLAPLDDSGAAGKRGE